MNKKIIVSLSVVAAVAAITVGATTAFFSDTETSTGNTFTAGAIDLKIDNESYAIDYNIPGYDEPVGALVASVNTSWSLTDLTIERFFNFIDLKPGDFGEDTISIRVGSNDAWLCASAQITSDLDNTCTDPEDETLGELCTVAIPEGVANGFGELDSELKFLFWKDDGDNVLENCSEQTLGCEDETENIFINGTLSDMGQQGGIALADSQGGILCAGNPIPASDTFHIGKAWCYGVLSQDPVEQDGLSTEGPLDGTPSPRGTGISCDGENVGNIGQTDSVVGDITFYAEQARNNPTFTCDSL